jgi:predicted kinase
VGRQILATGGGLVVEGNFWRGTAEPELKAMIETHEAVLVHCAASEEAIARRIKTRKGRHPQHLDSIADVLRALGGGMHEPLALDLPVLAVETDEGFAPGSTRSWRSAGGR